MNNNLTIKEIESLGFYSKNVDRKNQYENKDKNIRIRYSSSLENLIILFSNNKGRNWNLLFNGKIKNKLELENKLKELNINYNG